MKNECLTQNDLHCGVDLNIVAAISRPALRADGLRPVHSHADHFGKFFMLSLALHGVFLGAGVVFLVGYQPAQLSIAQGAVSLELISLPGQEGTAATPGDGAVPPPTAADTQKKKEIETAESTLSVQTNSSKILAENTDTAADAIAEAREKSPEPAASTPAPADTEKRSASDSKSPSVASATEHNPDSNTTAGHKAAQSGQASPGFYQPGTPGGVAPCAVSSPTPPYPEMARRSGAEGIVVLRLNIDPEGKVSRAEVVKSSGRGDFDHAAVETVEKRWRYRPALSWGHPVESAETVRVCFVLPESA